MKVITLTILVFPAACSLLAAMAYGLIKIGRRQANNYYPPYKRGMLYRKMLVRKLMKNGKWDNSFPDRGIIQAGTR